VGSAKYVALSAVSASPAPAQTAGSNARAMARMQASPLSAYPPSMRGTRWRAPVRPFTATEKALFDRTRPPGLLNVAPRFWGSGWP